MAARGCGGRRRHDGARNTPPSREGLGPRLGLGLALLAWNGARRRGGDPLDVQLGVQSISVSSEAPTRTRAVHMRMHMHMHMSMHMHKCAGRMRNPRSSPRLCHRS